MNKVQLAQNLATTLANGRWSETEVSERLRIRLPRAKQKLATRLSARLLAEFCTAYAPQRAAIAKALASTDELTEMFEYCLRRGVWPKPDLSEPAMLPIRAFAELPIPALATKAALSDWLAIDHAIIENITDLSGRHGRSKFSKVNHYNYIWHVKSSGALRLIEAPKQKLKSVQRTILNGIINKIPIHDDAFGFAVGRNCLSAAQRHASERVVLRFDLREFFPTVTFGRVVAIFRCLGYPQEVAHQLAGLCTTATPAHVLERLPPDRRQFYQRVHLPQGAPSSPALANLAAFALDRRLAGLAASVDANYSRYADDLCFSGDHHISRVLLSAVPDIIQSERFTLNSKKTRVMSDCCRQTVTGVVVNKHVNIARDKYDHLKSVIHRCSKPEDVRLNDPAFRASLFGQIGWVEACNPNKGRALWQKLESAVEERRKSASVG